MNNLTSKNKPQQTKPNKKTHIILLIILAAALLIAGVVFISKNCSNKTSLDNDQKSLNITNGNRDVPNSPVIDSTHVLNEKDINEITKRIINLDNDHLAQVAVVIVPSFEDKEPHAFADDFGNKYGVGNKDTDNGIVIAIKPKNENTVDGKGEVYISTGHGTEKKLTNDICNSIINEVMIPEFKQNNYAEGIKKAIDRIRIILTEAENK